MEFPTQGAGIFGSSLTRCDPANSTLINPFRSTPTMNDMTVSTERSLAVGSPTLVAFDVEHLELANKVTMPSRGIHNYLSWFYPTMCI